MLLKLQKIREGTKYESYRLSIPRAIVQVHKLENCKFKLEMQRKNLILIPVR